MAYLASSSGSVNGGVACTGKSAAISLRHCFRAGRRTKSHRHVTKRSPYADLDSASADDLWTVACGRDVGWNDGNLRAGHSPGVRRHALEIPHRRQQVSC